MFLSCMVSVVVIYLVFPQFRDLFLHELKVKSSIIGTLSIKTQVMGLLFGGTLIFILGLIDDKKSVQALTKLLVQIIAAYCVMDFGVRISAISFPGKEPYSFPIIISQVITLLWILGFMNTINLADGLDGLAAGIVTIAAGTFFIVSLLQSKIYDTLAYQLQLSAILSIILCGVTLGFLFFNFSPAKVFMGDSGALFLGFMLSTISILGTLKTTALIALFIPVIIVGLPILDVILSMYRRFSRGGNLMQPDKEHIHHRLLKLGLSQREVVLFIYVITLILSIIAITITALRIL